MANELEDPLMSQDKRVKKQAIYDRTAELVQYYRRGQLVQMHPGLAEEYRILGWKWQDLSGANMSPVETPKLEPEQREPEPVKVSANKPQTTQQPIKKDLSSWLDD